MCRALSASVLLIGVLPTCGFCQQTTQVDFPKAAAIAHNGVSGTLLFGRPEGANFGFYFLLENGRMMEREISGAGNIIIAQVVDVIENKPDNNRVDPRVVRALRARARVKLPLRRYLEIAQARTGGTATGYEMVLVGDQLQIQVTVTGANGNSSQVVMDMTTGRIIPSGS